jgi:hypothetical protein
MKTLMFNVKFNQDYTHWVQVRVFKTQSSMRRSLKNNRKFDSSKTQAACWQAASPHDDNCIAGLYFSREHLTLENIAHECCHAASHEAVVLGYKVGGKEFEESVCRWTGVLTDAVVAFLDKERVPIKYGCVPDRRML